MKKIVLVVALAVVLAAGAVFADHPKGWGIGVVGNYSFGFGGYGGGPGVGLSLKIPSVPVFWGLGMGFGSDYLNANVTGDYYFIDKALIPEAKLHWFLGLGGFFDYYHYSKRHSYSDGSIDYTYSHIDLGVRLPIGLSWQPLNFFELFANVAPSLGVDIYSGYDVKYTTTVGEKHNKEDSAMRLAFAVPVNLGLRFWL
jgi:opacity protein-like surface antigen